MEIQKAGPESLEEILNIYARAREFMAANGNPFQWGSTYPSGERVEQDIREGKCHICVEDGQILGVFYFAAEDEPTYHVIEDGEWPDDREYAVIHRIAALQGRRGVGGFCIRWAYSRFPNLRIDTGEANIPMQRLLEKLGFQYCGRIRLQDGSPRLAYQKRET